MSSGDRCKECGAAIPADSPGGFCAQCLLGLGLREVQSPASEVQGPRSEVHNPESEVQSLKSKVQSPESVTSSVTEKAGDRIGRYRLLEEIGHGGCGVVYMAEQEQPVRRKVALKVIKLGMDTKEVVARFEAERQALALMDHPNIAKVLDAGATEMGRPYFVMELVGGIKITDYCDLKHLTTHQRLDLFIQVCRAIQHAHQKGLIHRDIKPSNVLVATHDGVPVPKVIDFGIAKATQGRLTDQTLFTAFEQFIGTPAYMSPEQAQLGGVDVDTRSDIYSLGVLLYELLTGTTPFDTREMLARGLDEMRRTILEKEPPKPSTRLTQEFVAADVTRRTKTKIQNPKFRMESASSSRRLPTKELIHLLRGDLDWIVMKCLEKDRARRYETANGLAKDIERHLNNDPVVARPPTRLYSLQKLYRRNKLIVTASVAVVLVLLLGLGGIFSQWRRAEEHVVRERGERNRAETALAQMQAIELRRAEEYHEAGDRRNMLPYLALVLRQNPKNRIAAERLFSTLSHRNWARLACPPLMHSNRVTSAMFSRDGRWVVTSAVDNTAWVWDASTGKPLAGPLTHRAEINDAEFSPDGQLVVTASDDNTARVWDARTGRPVTEPLLHPARIELARFNPNSQTFVTLCDDRVARLWNARTGQSAAKPLRHGDGPAAGRFLRECDFSPDGRLLATAAWEAGRVRIWDCGTGEVAYNLEHGSSGPTCVRFSPDGRRLAAAFYTNTTVIWNLASNPPQVLSLLADARVGSVEFSPDGTRIVTASMAGTAQVWDVDSGKPIGLPLRHADCVRSAVFSPEGLRVVTASSDQTVRVWDAETGEPRTEPMRVENGAYYAQFHPDGQRVLSVSNGKAVLIWWISEEVSPAVFEPFKISLVEFNSDSTKVVVGTDQGRVQIWEPLTGATPTLLSGHNDYISSAAFSADGSHLATCSHDGTARVWDVASGRPVTKPLKIGAPGTEVFCVQFTPDSRRILTAWLWGAAQLWDVTSAEPASPLLGDGDGVRAVQLSPNGKWVATGGTNHMARIWDSVTGRPIGAIMHHEGPVLGLCFSPDSRRLLTASADKIARLWAVPSGEIISATVQHSVALWRVQFSPDGTRFLTIVTDRPSVRIWDSASGKLLTEIFAEDADVGVAEWSPDGRGILTVFRTGTAQLWDARTGERLSEPLPWQHSAGAPHFSPDGKFLASTSSDAVARFWEVAIPALPVPSWLPDLAEALGGQRFNQRGLVEPVSPVESWRVEEKMTAWAATGAITQAAARLPSPGPQIALAEQTPQRADDGWFRWAKWFLSPPCTRTVLPSSTLTLAKYALALAEHRVTADASREALLLQPTNVIAMDALARTTTNAILADWLSRRAVESAPDSQTALWARETILRDQGRFWEALALMERGSSLWEANCFVWADKGTSLERLGRLEEAQAAYSRALELAPRFEEFRIPVQEARWRLLRRMGRAVEAQKDFLEGIPLRASLVAGSRFDPIDLRSHLNQSLSNVGLARTIIATNVTAPVLMLGGVEFEMCGYIWLHNDDPKTDSLPEILGIQAGHQCSRLHFLQNCALYTNCPDGTLVGTYVVHYAGGRQEEIPIVYGQNVRDWHDAGKLEQASEGWSGQNDEGHPLRLVKFSWQNPYPEEKIQSIDMISKRTAITPILFAITAER